MDHSWMGQGFRLGLALTLLAGAALASAHQTDKPESKKDYDRRMAWWVDARFGLFIHWGPVSIQGTEIGWSRGGERRGYPFGNGTEVPVATYDNLYKRFNPTQFDAKKWVSIAKAAGMKYLVFTTRHHDGFSMFDTRLSDYRITSPLSSFGRDVVRELADACHEAGLRFGVYYSQPDWHNPDAFTERHEKYLAYMHGQVRELLTGYGKVDIIWFDGLGMSDKDYKAHELVNMIRAMQPNIIINDRSGYGGDFGSPEQTIGESNFDHRWETCMTLCNQWAWKPNDQMKSLPTCLQTLIRCAGGDGNLLFNVGPMPTGEFEPRQVERLEQMGAWLRKYGKTVYGTRGGPFVPTQDIVSTRRGKSIYLHLLTQPSDEVKLPALPAKVLRAAVLTGGRVDVISQDGSLQLRIQAKPFDGIDTIVRLDLDRETSSLAAIK